MLNNYNTNQIIKKKRNPDLEPFIIQKFGYIKVLSLLVLIPIAIGILITTLIFYDSSRLFLTFITVLSIISLIFSFVWSIHTYTKLSKYQLKGSIITNLSIILESSLLKFRSLIFPIFIFLIFASFLIPGLNTSSSNSTSTVDYSMIISFSGIIIPFIGLISIASLFFDHVDFTNNRVHDLSDKIIPDDFRNEIKEIGKKMGFTDVKIRLGDLFADDYGNHSWGIIKNNVPLIVFSGITFQKANKLQNTILITRELYRLKNRKINHYYFFGFLRNLAYILSFILLGIVIIILSQTTWNVWFKIDMQQGFIMLGLIIVAFLFTCFFLKIYLDSFELLNDLKSDRDVISSMSNAGVEIQDFKIALLHVSKLNPLVTETKGLNIRSNAVNFLFPEKDKPKKTGITWDDI